jgi:hypothetical protein
MRALTPEQFWERVIPEPNTGCYLWCGTICKDGYGKLSWHGADTRAHRLAWELTHGKTKLCVLHRCDTPACCNPAHLFVGTIAENIRDMDAKMRRGCGNINNGERRPNHKLTEDDVRAIRAARSPRFLARRYGVASETIRLIRRGKAWRHVQ